MKKRFLQRLSAMLTVMVLFISAYVPTVAEALTVNAMTTIGSLSSSNPFGYALDVQRINLSGNMAFCIEPNATMKNSNTYTNDQSNSYWTSTLSVNQRYTIGLILYYGYYNNASSHRTDAYLAATQILCWEVTGFHRPYKTVSPLRTFDFDAHTSTCSDSLLNYYSAKSGGPSKSAVTTAYNDIVKNVKNHTAVSSGVYDTESAAKSNAIKLTYNSSTRRYETTIKRNTSVWNDLGLTNAIKALGLGVSVTKADDTYSNYTIYSTSSFTSKVTSKVTKASTNKSLYGNYTKVMVYKNSSVTDGQVAVLGGLADPVTGYMAFAAPATTGSYTLSKLVYDPARKSTGSIASYMDNYDEVRSELIRFYVTTSSGQPVGFAYTGSSGQYGYTGTLTSAPTQMTLSTTGTLNLLSLPYGSYRLYEVAASGKHFEDYGLEEPTGYTSFTISSPGTGGGIVNRMMLQGSLSIKKKFTLTDGSTAPNSFYTQCSFRIKNSAGEYIKLTLDDAESGSYSFDSKVSSAGAATLVKLGTSTKTASIEGLELGTYTVEEVMTGNAFTAKAASQNATLTSDSTVTVTFENVENGGDLNVHKITEGGTDLGGIRFTFSGPSASGRQISVSGVTDDEGNLSFKNIPIGSNYTLEEDRSTVPVGYVTADPVTGVVIEYNEATNVDVKNDETDVVFSKKKLTGEDELPGASLQVIDKSGEIVDEWISTDKPHELKGVLEAGETYTLHEEASPNGYVISEDIEFTVSEDGSVDTVVMRDAPTYVSISKKTLSGEDELPGAKLQVLDAEGTVIEEWVSTDKPHEVVGKLIAGEEYILHEVSAPNGYVVAEDIPFTVSDDGSVDPVIMRDAPTVVYLSKKTLTGEDELPGATLQVIDSEGTVIEEWVSSYKPHVIEAKLIAGASYVLHEEAAPDGYVIAQDIPFTVTLDGSTVTVEMKDAPTTVELSKKKITGDDELPGAKLQVIDSKGNVIDSWTSTSKPHIITARLVAGATYILHEEASPDGYVIASDVTFTVSTNGQVDKVVMKDDTTKVYLYKTDLTTGKELPGAKLQLIDSDGMVIDEWTSTTEPHKIEAKLVAGKSYTLHEVIAPDGYVIANDVTFKVSTNGQIDKVYMKDDTTKVHLSKKDITNDEELPGAKLQVIDSEGNVVDEWISTDKPHKIEGKLVAGATYILHEVIAPDGYVIANDVTFKVSTNGQVDVVTMKDDTTKVHLSKKDITNDEELPGAKLQVIDSEGNIVDEWISTNEPHEIEGKLTAGKEYTLHEEIAPDGYVVANDVTFTVSENGQVDVVEMKDDTTKVHITKVDAVNGEVLVGAVLQILDTEGTVIDEWISEEEPHKIECVLVAGETYILHEVEAPEGYVLAEDYEFVAPTTGAVVEIVMKDDIMTGEIQIKKLTEGMLNIEGIELMLVGTSQVGIEVNMSSITDEDGTAYFEGVPIGVYMIIENGATVPYGYLTADPIEGVEVTYAEVTTVEIYNTEMTGTLHIKKGTSDNNSNAVAGIDFVLSGPSQTGRQIELTATSDENGDVWFESVPIGIYTITEVGSTVPTGYLVADPIEGVEIVYAEQTDIVVINDKVPTPENPKTGDDTTKNETLAIMLIAMVGICVLHRRKNSNIAD